MKEFALGEVFAYRGKIYKVIEDGDGDEGCKMCKLCVFNATPNCQNFECRYNRRSDETAVHFVEVKEEEYLEPKEALKRMIDGEHLQNSRGLDVWFNEGGCNFQVDHTGNQMLNMNIQQLKPYPKKEPTFMTPWKMLAWAQSNKSVGWLAIQCCGKPAVSLPGWISPICFTYDDEPESYWRARYDENGIIDFTISQFINEEK